MTVRYFLTALSTSCPRLSRASTSLRLAFAGTWMAGASPAMTVERKDLHFKDPLLGLVQALADAARFDHIIIAYRHPHRRGLVAWVDREIHAGLQRHRFVRS